MNSNLIDKQHQNFEHNIKKEPEEEYLCILPRFESEIAHERDLVQVKREKEIQPENLSKFRCKICQKIVGSNQSLRKHEEAHQKQQCKVCNRKFSPHSFEKHMKSHQNDKSERKFKCKICFQKYLTKWNFLAHVLRHSRRFQCDLCGHFTAGSKHDLMVHLTLHLAQGQYKCMFCRKMFDDRESFRFHSRQIHGDPKNRLGLTRADLSCGTCGKEFDNIPARKQHEKSHGEKIQCPFCDKKYQPVLLARHLKNHESMKKGKTFICDICSKSFITKASLSIHKRIHNKFKCDVCGYENAFKRNLKDHLEEHLNPKRRKCKICWKTFTNTNALKYHSRTIHEPSKLFCNICNVKCRNLLAFKTHKSNHKVSKTCPICFKSINPQSFYTHMKLHKLKREEKKFKCTECKKKFYTKSILNQHMKTHTKSLECDLCEYRTGRKQYMNHHMVKHMKQKPFECEICHRRFSSKVNLKRHRCPASFVVEKKLNRHMKTHAKFKNKASN